MSHAFWAATLIAIAFAAIAALLGLIDTLK
jgi:hypothetical protein